MNRTHCFLTAIIVISIFSRVYAQLPSLSPSQTVNPATGEMGFSLPLGVVHGIGGHDFPVTLNYKAGIDYQQKSSPVGLGFSYDAGSITRKVVFVPDDNSRDNAYSEYTPRPDCSTPIWVYIVSVVCAFISFVVTILLAVFNPPLAPGGAFLISLSLGLMLSTTQLFIS